MIKQRSLSWLVMKAKRPSDSVQAAQNSLDNFSVYHAQWKNPDMEHRIAEGIERYRKSDATVRLTDFSGKPMPGIKFRVEQYDSSFHFGANLFKLGCYPTAEQNRKYEDAFCGLFNAATLPFYWSALEPEQGHPRFHAHSVPIDRRPPPDKTVQFCEERGLRIHGHTLVWNSRRWSPPEWVPKDPAKAAPLWEKRIREIGERYGSRIKRWDVINEAVAHYERHPGGLSMLPDYEAQSFEWAEKYFPADARLDINETVRAWDADKEEYIPLIQHLLAAGRRVGALGLQFHLFSDQQLADVIAGKIYSPEGLLETLDQYAALHLPIHISEITLTAPGNSIEGIYAQALVARNLYRLWFSHPAVEGITWWNVPDGGAASGEDKVYSGLLYDDMQPKLSYHALKELIHREWRTQVEGTTDADGCFHFRGFHGTYHVTTQRDTRNVASAFTLEPGKSTQHSLSV